MLGWRCRIGGRARADGRRIAVMEGKKVLFCKSETAGRQSARGRTPHRSISPLLAASIQINCISERTGERERERASKMALPLGCLHLPSCLVPLSVLSLALRRLQRTLPPNADG
ncbi:hypothetical protein Q8A67_022727 [Cirrhinus molitorella]|uniref:Uncharacterized protein n=1 Tax=Cirrhinus molitorella TaxID=172907 RepID=A0AA88P4L2_9TELE|nr:hypothetical protein Q8A67_022727 [Cirrhinus molitorella]